MANERVRGDAATASRDRRRLRALARDTRGTGLVEYIIIVGVVALGAQTAFRVFGKSLSDKVKQQGDTVASIDSDCVGGLCTVTIKKDKETP